MGTINRSVGLTASERYLATLCDRTFLDLWSYPNVFRKPGKELCDLLVVCGDIVVIFSEKFLKFKETGDLEKDWSRWFNRAVIRSAKQLKRARSWIQEHPDKIYLDPKCNETLPIELASKASLYMIVVAGGAKYACRRFFGSNRGSMMLSSAPKNQCAQAQIATLWPFNICYSQDKANFIHVLDEVTLDLLLSELDTITDLTKYLDEKAEFFCSDAIISAAGEEELLSYYFKNYNDERQYHFPVDRDGSFVTLEEGLWDEFVKHPQYKERKKHNEISYIWDGLIKIFTKHVFQGTTTHWRDWKHEKHEGGVRYMALEPRVHRRILSAGFLDAFDKAPIDTQSFRLVLPESGDILQRTIYGLLQVSFDKSRFENYEAYREYRSELLFAYCVACKDYKKDISRIVGIAMEPPKYNKGSLTSEDMILIEPEAWSDELIQVGADARKNFNIANFENVENNVRVTVSDFPSVPYKVLKKHRIDAQLAALGLAADKMNRSQRRAVLAKHRRRGKVYW